MRASLLLAVLLVILSADVFSQVSPPPQDTAIKYINLIYTDLLGYKRIDSANSVQILSGNVKLEQEGTIFECDSAVIKNNKIVEAFGNVHINDKDSVHTYSQYLLYYVDTKIATLKKNVKLTDGKITLLTEELQYDVNQRIGEYHTGGRLINGESVLTSQEGIYYADLKDVYFKKDVKLKDPKYSLQSDSLLYNTETELTTFIAQTYIVDSAGRKIRTREGYYDLKNKRASFSKRPVIQDGAVTVIANEIDSNDSTGISKLRGNAVYTDTAQGVSVLANYIDVNNRENSFLATRHPLMILKQDNDSIYVAADTLLSGRLSKLRTPVPDSAINQPDTLQKLITADTVTMAGDSTNIASRSKPPALQDTTINQTDTLQKLVLMDTVAGQNDSIRAVSLNNPPTVQDTIVNQSDTLQKLVLTDTVAGQNDSIPAVSLNNPPAVQDTTVNQADTLRGVVMADTLSKDNDSTDRYFMAYHNVRIFSDSLQARSDSLFYSGKDSIFRLFTNPVIWASGSQVTGDTIYLYTKNKKADQLYVFENGLIVNNAGENMFNQIRGNRINGYFNDGVIDYMRAKGNAESVYYSKDDEGYLVGINKATADIIDLRFKDKELNRVVLISNASGTLYPVSQISPEDRKLRNFQWLEDKRPKTKFELFEE